MAFENEFGFSDNSLSGAQRLLKDKKISAVNKLSAVSYQGESGGSLSPALKSVNEEESLGNSSISKIIENSHDLSPSDFLYTKGFGRMPTNRLVLLRRFPFPIHDIMPPVPPLAKAVTYIDKGVEFIPSISLELPWEEISGSEAAGFDQSGGGGIPGAGSVTKQLDYESLSTLLSSSGINLKNNLPRDPSERLGGTKVLKSFNWIGAGVSSNVSFEYTFEYKMKYIDGVDPKLALLDLLANILILTYDKIRFFTFEDSGRFIWEDEDFSNKYTLEAISKQLKNAGSSAAEAIGNRFREMLDGGSTLSDVSISDLVDGAVGSLDNFKFGRNAMKKLFQIYVAMSGAPTGSWHLTVGNPLNPIISWGNLIVTNTEIQLTNSLGDSDFPDGFTATISLSPGRDIDRDELFSKFNVNRGGLYIPPSSTGDVNQAWTGSSNNKPVRPNSVNDSLNTLYNLSDD